LFLGLELQRVTPRSGDRFTLAMGLGFAPQYTLPLAHFLLAPSAVSVSSCFVCHDPFRKREGGPFILVVDGRYPMLLRRQLFSSDAIKILLIHFARDVAPILWNLPSWDISPSSRNEFVEQ